MRQLPLELSFPPRFGVEDFLIDPSNAEPFRMVEAWPAWPSRTLLLIGPPGSGKSHLSAIWAGRASARIVAGADIGDSDLGSLSRCNLVIENADQVGQAEAPLFHLLNLTRESDAYLLLTAPTPPDLWRLSTADLLSRLRLAPLLRLQAPDDALVRAVLIKLIVDRQLVVDQSVIDYLALRIERSIGAARAAVEALDRLSLAEGRRITRPIAADMLASLAP